MSTVLITGFAGSLGSEFTRQLIVRGDTVTGVDNNEWAVASFPEHPRLKKVLGDFYGMAGAWDLIIHCAAYKHIDLVEANREAGTFNNVKATELLYRNITGSILFISTDKAVEPSSWYGLTKQKGEEMTHELGGVVARLGNILSSSGSVIPKWERALEAGEPLPITNPQMSRYLISASEAVSKVLALLPEATAGSTIIPEMGAPVVLGDLVAQVLALHAKPADYPLVVVGARAAEKLHEKLKWDDEETIYADTNGIIVRR